MSIWPDLSLSTVRFDRGTMPVRLGATPIEVRPDGYRVYRGVAAFGDVVLEYPEEGRSEFAPASVVLADEALKSTVGVPFTIHHPDDMLSSRDEETLKRETEGAVLRAEANWKADPPELVVDVIVYTASAQEAVESGRVADLSLGYNAKDERRPGMHKGKPYQVVQTARRSNHLSGVYAARSTAPDGRRARLDEAGAGASYARRSMDESLITAAPIDLDADTTADGRKDADPEAPAGDPAEEQVMVAEVEMPAAEALSMFSPEAADILKTLPPDDLALLAMMAKQMKAEAAEQAVMAAPEGAEVEVEAEDASKAAKAKEAIGEDLKVAAGKAEEAAASADATAPMAPQGLTMDAVKQMIADAIAAAMPKADKYDGKPSAQAQVAAPVSAVRLDTAAVATKIREARRMDAEFVDAARKDGHVQDGASVNDAAAAMFAVVVRHLPLLAPVAKEHLKTGRRDAFLQVYAQAEDIRRAGHLDAQAGLFTQFTAAPVDENAALLALSTIGRPGAAD